MPNSNASDLVMIDRRVTLKWLMGAMAAGQLAACGDGAKGVTWAEMEAIKAKGYGTDPDFNNTAAPWPLTMTQAELVAASSLADIILPADGDYPAPSKLGVPAFIDEWVSAPYPDQHRDRVLIINGLAWLDQESRARSRAIFASGSPFPPLHHAGKLFVPGQGNNVYIYPAVGLAVYVTQASRVTDDMFLRAAESLAAQVTDEDLHVGLIYPPVAEIHETLVKEAIDVATMIFDKGLARVPRPADIAAFVRAQVYDPTYPA